MYKVLFYFSLRWRIYSLFIIESPTNICILQSVTESFLDHNLLCVAFDQIRDLHLLFVSSVTHSYDWEW